jgi:GT2 family glycosyltransferase
MSVTRPNSNAATPRGKTGHSCATNRDEGSPCVSFVVIAFNESANIASCLRSLGGQDAQCQLEFIVVDDGSSDDTRRIADAFARKDPRVRVIALTPNQGRGAARAAGVAAARGDYVAFVDADIVLPAHWLTRALGCLASGLDACGGIAVPDGDAAFLFHRFGLRPRPVSPSRTVAGSNSLFRRSVFERVGISAQKRNGEDVDLVHQMERVGLRLRTVTDLIVEHRETKGFQDSVRWLFASGIGASAQLREQRRVRTPDVAFAGLLACVVAAGMLHHFGRLRGRAALAMPAIYVALTAGGHLSPRFELRATPLRSATAWLCNCVLIASYFGGRVRGLLGPTEGSR